ncbi:hypothetical protein AAC387_Pa10g0327 [Persea americana]
MVTNNFTESWNNFVGDARYLPICDMVDAIRIKLMIKLQERRDASSKWTTTIVPPAMLDLMKTIEKAHNCRVRHAGEFEYEVDVDKERYKPSFHKPPTIKLKTPQSSLTFPSTFPFLSLENPKPTSPSHKKVCKEISICPRAIPFGVCL